VRPYVHDTTLRNISSYQRLTVTAERGNRTTRAVGTVRIAEVGSTTVEPPVWLDEAEAQNDGE